MQIFSIYKAGRHWRTYILRVSSAGRIIIINYWQYVKDQEGTISRRSLLRGTIGRELITIERVYVYVTYAYRSLHTKCQQNYRKALIPRNRKQDCNARRVKLLRLVCEMNSWIVVSCQLLSPWLWNSFPRETMRFAEFLYLYSISI